jgi:hypothetical protein
MRQRICNFSNSPKSAAMKRITVFAIGLLFSVGIIAQNVGVGTNTPAASAQLEVSSTNKGFLLPRMTAVQRDSIAAPVAGLMVYCSNCGTNGGEMQYYNGSSWRNMTGSLAALPARGQPYRGGMLTYVLQPGDQGYDPNTPHGLIATTMDISSGIAWDIGPHQHIPCFSEAIGSGNANTLMIVNAHGTGSYAARLCYDLVLNGYSDWYLPSFNELLTLNALAPVMPDAGDYWSSTAVFASTEQAISVFLWFADYAYYSKSDSCRVRAFRSF